MIKQYFEENRDKLARIWTAGAKTLYWLFSRVIRFSKITLFVAVVTGIIGFLNLDEQAFLNMKSLSLQEAQVGLIGILEFSSIIALIIMSVKWAINPAIAISDGQHASGDNVSIAGGAYLQNYWNKEFDSIISALPDSVKTLEQLKGWLTDNSNKNLNEINSLVTMASGRKIFEAKH